MFETNTFGAPPTAATRVLPAWRVRGHGVVVNVSSVQGRVATPLEGPYCGFQARPGGLLGDPPLRARPLRHPGGHRPARLHRPGDEGGAADTGHGDYQELWEQWSGTDAHPDRPRAVGPGPKLVADGPSAGAIEEDPSTPLRGSGRRRRRDDPVDPPAARRPHLRGGDASGARPHLVARIVSPRPPLPATVAALAGVAQWLESLPSKQAMRVRFPSPAPRLPRSPSPPAGVLCVELHAKSRELHNVRRADGWQLQLVRSDAAAGTAWRLSPAHAQVLPGTADRATGESGYVARQAGIRWDQKGRTE